LFDSIQDRVEKDGSASDNDNKSRLRIVEIVSGELSDLAERSYSLLIWLQDEAAVDLGIAGRGAKSDPNLTLSS
jgi:hypothetical protein